MGLCDLVCHSLRGPGASLIERLFRFQCMAKRMLRHRDASQPKAQLIRTVTRDSLKYRERHGGLSLKELDGTQQGKGEFVRQIDRDRMLVGFARRLKISGGEQTNRQHVPSPYRQRIEV